MMKEDKMMKLNVKSSLFDTFIAINTINNPSIPDWNIIEMNKS
jgi:hypothetical protein